MLAEIGEMSAANDAIMTVKILYLSENMVYGGSSVSSAVGSGCWLSRGTILLGVASMEAAQMVSFCPSASLDCFSTSAAETASFVFAASISNRIADLSRAIFIKLEVLSSFSKH